MKKLLIKLLTSALVVTILFQFIVIEKSNVVLASDDWEGYDETAVEEEKNIIEDDRSFGQKLLDGFLSLILTPIRLLLYAPRIDIEWNYNSLR